MSDNTMTVDKALTILDKVANELGNLRNLYPRVFADTIEDECDLLWEANIVIRAHIERLSDKRAWVTWFLNDPEAMALWREISPSSTTVSAALHDETKE